MCCAIWQMLVAEEGKEKQGAVGVKGSLTYGFHPTRLSPPKIGGPTRFQSVL